MRRLFFILWLGLAMASLARSPRPTDAATIEGRVVDSRGKPLAGAEVRIWQRIRGADAPFAVEFDGSDVLITDADGRFVSPDVLVAGSPAQVVAEASGMLAGRSGWITIAKDQIAAQAPDITLKSLRLIIGRVVDRRGQPVDGATVFNAGDGHERVEARSKGGGKFLLTEVPKGGVFLFAEKPGYRFTGVRLPADQAEATLVLTSLDEPAEPKATLPPLLSPDEEYALARAVLDPWLERLAKSGTPNQRNRGFRSLAQVNGREAFARLDLLGDVDQPTRDYLRYVAICSVIADHDRVSWKEVRAMIEVGDDEYYKAAELIQATDEMDEHEQATRLEWLDSALSHARRIDDPTRRVRLLASVAERLFGLAEAARARPILVEAENGAKPLLPDAAAHDAFLHLALAAMHDDADRAIDWLAKVQPWNMRVHGGRVAVGLLPERPQKAAEVCKHVAEAVRQERSRTGFEYRAAAEFCYRLALVDRPLAEQVAADADETVMRYRAKGAILLALAETQPAEARRLLKALVREELAKLPTEAFRFLPQESAPAIAAWLLPLAERIDPDLCGELFWRSLALRLPRPRRSGFNNEAERTDIQLARLPGRYDRDIARALLEPTVANTSAPDPVQALMAGGLQIQRFSAAVYVDPRWAKTLLDKVAESPSLVELDHYLRFYFVYYRLAPPPLDRWIGQGESTGFWEPSAKDRPLPP